MEDWVEHNARFGGRFIRGVRSIQPPDTVVLSTSPFSLTLGLMGLDELHLRVLSTSADDSKEKQNAVKGIHAFPHSMSYAHDVQFFAY